MSHAFRWDATTGVVDLGSSVAGGPSRANRISADGKVIVGWQGLPNGFWQGARWSDGRQELLVGPLGPVSEAQAINHDGSIIAGTRCSGITQDGWIMTTRDGIECLPAPNALRPGGPVIEALSLSDDGRVIGGAQTFGLDSAAVLWINREPFYLRDYLRERGVPQARTDADRQALMLGEDGAALDESCDRPAAVMPTGAVRRRSCGCRGG